jgi:hypothetical protein
MQNRKVLSLRVVMDDELEDKFNKIKDELGLSSNAEVIRFLVNRFYKELVKKGSILSLAFLKTSELMDILDTAVMDATSLLV